MKPTRSFFPPRPTSLAHDLLAHLIAPGDHVVDATAGNGHDTVFLADRVGPEGKVWAFDVQDAAIASTARKLDKAGLSGQVSLIRKSHALMREHVAEGSIGAVMFNLGYLPGEDHDCTTEKEETLTALLAATAVLKPGGVLSVICYPGHESGGVEAETVTAWMEGLASQGWRVARYQAVGTLRAAPFLLMARKDEKAV